MDNKNVKIALQVAMNARDIIGLLALPEGKYGYEDFEDEQMRDIYYKLNSICCELISRRDALSAKNN